MSIVDEALGTEKKSIVDEALDTPPKDVGLAQKLAQAVDPYTRYGLPAAGAIVGGIAALPVNLGLPGVAEATGIGLGTLAGQQGANYIGQVAGRRGGLDPKEVLMRDIPEAGINAFSGPLISKGYQFLKGLGESGGGLFAKQAATKAADIITKNTGKAPAYLTNKAAADELEELIPGYKLSLGEKTADPNLIKLQRGLERSPGQAADIMAQQRAGNTTAAREYISKAFPEKQNADDFINELVKQKTAAETATKAAQTKATGTTANIVSTDAQQAGKGVLKKIEDTMYPVIEEEGKLWSQVDNYPIATPNTARAFKEAINTPNTAEPLLREIQTIFNKSPQSVTGLHRVEQEINSAINSPTATETQRHFLKQVRDGIRNDIEALGNAADNGDIMLHENNIIYPSQIKKDQELLTKQIAENLKQPDAKANIDLITKALQEKGIPFMKVTGESEKNYIARITDAYQKNIGGEVPKVEWQEPAIVNELRNKHQSLQNILDNAQPAENVAIKIKEAKTFSKEQKFDRFDKAAVHDILKYGNEANGKSVADGEIARKFMNPDDADQLIKAVGGQKQAASVMEGFIALDMESKVINPTTKEIVPEALSRWVTKNKPVLDKYGLTAKFQNASNAHKVLAQAKETQEQFGKSIAGKILNADPKVAIERAMEGAEGISAKNTGAIMEKLLKQVGNNKDAQIGLKVAFKDFILSKSESMAKTISGESVLGNAKLFKSMKKYEPAMRVLYKDEPHKLEALMNVQKAIETSSRSASSPIGGGSDTAENVNTALGAVATAAGHLTGHSILTTLANKGLGMLSKLNTQQTEKLLARAMYDTDLAESLMMARKGIAPKEVERRIEGTLTKMGIYSTTAIIKDKL